MALASPATSDKVVITTDAKLFNEILTDFYEGVSSRKLHSRSKTKEWKEYAKHLEDTYAAAAATTAPKDVTTAPPSGPARKPRKTRARIVPPDITFIPASAAVTAGLNKLQSFKLSNLYNSLTTIRLDEHPALLTTGAWVFLETLCALHGSKTEFVGYVGGKYAAWGIKKDEAKECRLSLEYIQSHGNAQKHSAIFSIIDARNLHNHFQVLEKVLTALIDDCIAAKGGKS